MRSLVLDLHELLSSHVYVMVHLALVPSSVVLVVCTSVFAKMVCIVSKLVLVRTKLAHAPG